MERKLIFKAAERNRSLYDHDCLMTATNRATPVPLGDRR